MTCSGSLTKPRTYSANSSAMTVISAIWVPGPCRLRRICLAGTSTSKNTSMSPVGPDDRISSVASRPSRVKGRVLSGSTLAPTPNRAGCAGLAQRPAEILTSEAAVRGHLAEQLVDVTGRLPPGGAGPQLHPDR